MKYLICLVALFYLALPAANAREKTVVWNISLRTGDLLFCSTTSGELSKAIDQATQTVNKTHFDHVGIVELADDALWVLHAAPKKGVSREPIESFLSTGEEPVNVTVYRLNDRYSKAIPAAIQKAGSLLGQRYNFTYKMNESGYYCSEYIYEIFKADSIFTLDPMTFKDHKNGEFLPGWIDYYKKLKLDIPEGEDGCNPNGLSASGKLDRLGILSLTSGN